MILEKLIYDQYTDTNHTTQSSELLNGLSNNYDGIENDGVTVKRPNAKVSYTVIGYLETPTNLFVSLPAELTFTNESLTYYQD